jgi:hypothetical protein
VQRSKKCAPLNPAVVLNISNQLTWYNIPEDLDLEQPYPETLAENEGHTIV